MNQYEQVFRNMCEKLISLSPEDRTLYLNGLGFDVTVDQCRSMGSKEEMRIQMEQMAKNLQDDNNEKHKEKTHMKKGTTITCYIGDQVITIKEPLPIDEELYSLIMDEKVHPSFKEDQMPPVIIRHKSQLKRLRLLRKRTEKVDNKKKIWIGIDKLKKHLLD